MARTTDDAIGAVGAAVLLLSCCLLACSGRIAEPEAGMASRAGVGERGGVERPPPTTEMPPVTDAGPDAPGSGPAPRRCIGLGDAGAPVPLRRLNASQVERTVEDVLGVEARVAVTDERLFTYRSNVSAAIDATGARAYLDFAETTVAQADLERCATESCLDWLLDEVGLRLFRRPLDPEQRARYQALYDRGEGEGARFVLEAMLQSPSFLYLDEVVNAQGYLDDYSIAARLALVLWGSNPDLALLERAGEARLSTAEQIREEATRMLDDPRSAGGVRDFVDQWLELHRLDEADARPDLAALGAETVEALRQEPVRFFHALLAQGGALSDLLTAAESPRSDALAAIYGADVVATTAAAFSLDPARRAGILTLPGVMAALSHAHATSPTLRGYAVLASFLCTPPPPPPAGVSVTLPEVGPDASARERLELHFSDDSCGSCHRSMDGIGFAFERIDWLGQSRDTENGREIDDTSTFALAGQEVTVDGAVELAATMADTDAVAACVARQWARYATGVPETPEAACLMQRLAEDLPQQGGLRAMMLTYLGSDWFRRGNGGAP